MAQEQAKIDDNRRKALLGVTDDENEETRNLIVDATTGRLKVSAIVGSGSLVSINDDTTNAQIIALGSTGTDANIVDNGTGTHTIHLPTASASARGLMSTTYASKLDGIEAAADVTDTTNVTAAGALMDSEVDADLKTFSLPANTTISAFGASIIDDADEATFKATVNLEIGTDVLAQQTIGIANDNLVEMDDADAADNDYAKFTATGLEGRSYAEMRSDLNIEDGADVTDATNVAAAGAVMEADYNANTILAATDDNTPVALEVAEQKVVGRLTGGAIDDIAIGIADDNVVQMDDADAADNDYCKLTANGIEGRSYSEVKTDLSLDNVENTAISTWAGSANITTVGTLSAGDTTATTSAASDSAAGKVELATTAETETGTDATRAVTPDGLHDMTTLSGAAWFKDEDDMSSDSATTVASQQSIKAYIDSGTVTMTNKTLTLPTFTNGAINFNAPEGFLINGEISVTDASGITVAIKTLAGTDPSASDPVYIRLNGEIRSITSALSVTKADGTNWCNAGSAELATEEIDYFVYLGYNATDGVVIGFSRIPFANEYDDFSTTTTDEKYCAISTITNAASGDDYEVIGRFAATLSAGAGYTWTVPTFTNKNLIQRPIFNTRKLVWQPTWGGFSSAPTKTGLYIIRESTCWFAISPSNGTSTTGDTTMSLPISSININSQIPARVCDNGINQIGLIVILGSGIIAYKNLVVDAFTTSGAKNVYVGGEEYSLI